MKKLVSIIFVILLAFGCTHSKNKKQANEDILQESVKYCMIPLIDRGLSEDKSREICECVLGFLFEMDSTILTMSQEEFKQMFEANENEILESCDELNRLLKENN